MDKNIKTYKKLDSATKIVGFDVTLPSRYEPKIIAVIDDSILELSFASLIARKTKLTENYNQELGVSGIETGLPSGYTGMPFKTNGVEGKQYWNGSSQEPKIYLCVYTFEGFAYSIYAQKGLTIKNMDNWKANFR